MMQIISDEQVKVGPFDFQLEGAQPIPDPMQVTQGDSGREMLHLLHAIFIPHFFQRGVVSHFRYCPDS